MNPILVSFAVGAGVMIVGWLLVGGSRLLSRTRRHGSPESRSRPRRSGGAAGDAEAILTGAKLKAAEILADAERERERLLEERLASAERSALELRAEAEQEAEAIVKNGELKAGAALSRVERERGRLEQQMQEVAREQALMAVKQKRLSEFLLTALEEIERASANGSTNIAELQVLRDELRSSE